MINLAALIHRLRSRAFLVTVALLLAVLNLGRFTISYFEDRQQQVENRLALLQQNRSSLARLDGMRQRVKELQKISTQASAYLFRGRSAEKIASAMQIVLQEKVAQSGLEPESLRPITRGDKNPDKKLHEIAIKLRLSGSQQQFMEFLAELYRSKQLFIIENFVIKPTRQNDLKILMDLKGFYQIPGGAAEAAGAKVSKKIAGRPLSAAANRFTVRKNT